MTDLPDTPSTALADLLERCGKTRSEAEALAAEMVQRQRAVDPGCTWGHVLPEQIVGLWNQAAKHGKRKLVLEITADAPYLRRMDRRAYSGHRQGRADLGRLRAGAAGRPRQGSELMQGVIGQDQGAATGPGQSRCTR